MTGQTKKTLHMLIESANKELALQNFGTVGDYLSQIETILEAQPDRDIATLEKQIDRLEQELRAARSQPR